MFVEIGGDAKLYGELNILTDDLVGLAYGDIFRLMDIGGRRIGRFVGLGEGEIVGEGFGYDLVLSYVGGDGNDIVVTAVPEPSGLFLIFVAGAFGFVGRRG